MNITMRKLAMLEKSFIEQEEARRIDGLVSCPIDRNLKEKISDLMDKVRAI